MKSQFLKATISQTSWYRYLQCNSSQKLYLTPQLNTVQFYLWFLKLNDFQTIFVSLGSLSIVLNFNFVIMQITLLAELLWSSLLDKLQWRKVPFLHWSVTLLAVSCFRNMIFSYLVHVACIAVLNGEGVGKQKVWEGILPFSQSPSFRPCFAFLLPPPFNIC